MHVDVVHNFVKPLGLSCEAKVNSQNLFKLAPGFRISPAFKFFGFPGVYQIMPLDPKG